jgi:DNA-binding transcriptional ArsR family regulator
MSARGGSAARHAAPVFAALGDTTRLGLVRRLSAEGPLSITRLSEGTGMTRQAVTRHLHALARVGLVRDAREGRQHIFSLDLKRFEVARQYLDHVSAQWDRAAARLQAFVEQDETPTSTTRP